MAIWGKILGGSLGMALGGPLGLILGAAAGHGIDRARKAAARRAVHDGYGGLELQQQSWTVTFFILAARLSKVDGHVHRDEVATIKQVFGIPQSADSVLGPIFREAINDTKSDHQDYARQIAQIFSNNRQPLEQLIGALVTIATCDGHFHPNERAFIEDVGQCFGFNAETIRRIINSYVQPGTSDADDSPYQVLGVAPDASDEEVREAHRRIIKEFHPDVAISKGLPEEFIDLCNTKMANANAAYDTIKARRNLG